MSSPETPTETPPIRRGLSYRRYLASVRRWRRHKPPFGFRGLAGDPQPSLESGGRLVLLAGSHWNQVVCGYSARNLTQQGAPMNSLVYILIVLSVVSILACQPADPMTEEQIRQIVLEAVPTPPPDDKRDKMKPPAGLYLGESLPSGVRSVQIQEPGTMLLGGKRPKPALCFYLTDERAPTFKENPLCYEMEEWVGGTPLFLVP